MQTGYRIVVSALGWFAIILQYSLIASTRSGPDLVAWTINYFSFTLIFFPGDLKRSLAILSHLARAF